jgi:hypothetical protein
MFTWPSNKEPLDWSVKQVLIFIFRKPEIYKRFGISIGIIAIICVFGYLLNRYQMKNKKEFEEEQINIMKERIARRKER